MESAGALTKYLDVKVKSEKQDSSEDLNLVKLEPVTEEDDDDDVEYMEVEYLQDDDEINEIYKIIVTDNEEATTSKSKAEIRNANRDDYEPEEEQEQSDEEYEKPKSLMGRKQKKKKSRRRKTYRNYTEQQLKDAIKAVKENRLTLLEASLKFNIPKKTLAYKWVQKPKNTPEALIKEEERFIQASFLKDIETVLEYTNAVPFKTTHSRFYCIYCGAPPRYDEFEDLKDHINTEHPSEERTKNLEQVMKPTWLNEVLRVDIVDLHCTVCRIKLEGWNSMFEHLGTEHSMELSEGYTRIIPYTIKSNFPCALCNEPCQNYHYLDTHMNAHYNNYICAECGDSYLTKSRYEKHLETHENGKYPCKECNKVFTLEKYMRKHMKYSHVSNSVRCRHCDERFHGEYHRHIHMLEAHKDKVKIVTCEMCGAVFDWRPYYVKHLKRYHNSENVYQCKHCDSRFCSVSDLKVHKETHSGEKRFRCDICDRRYSTAMWLKNHMKKHSDSNKTTVVIVTEKKAESEVNDSS